MNIHFIAIGGSVMHNLAVALLKKGYTITGSDEEIFEPARSRLVEHGLLPEKKGWNPDSIHSGLDAIILGMGAKKSNKELKKAEGLGIRVYSISEYLYELTRNKKRIVIGGSHGKTIITAMVMHVLRNQKKDFDYMVSTKIPGFDSLVKLTKEAPFIILEGDEYLSSPIHRTPKFHQYNPHMTLLSGISWDHMNLFRSFECYKKQFRKYLRIATGGGKVFYYDGDPVLGEIVDKSHWSLMKIPYGEHPYRIEGDRFFLDTKYGTIPLNLIGRHNMQNITGAQVICHDLGVEDHQFYSSIQSFKGVERRQQLLASGKNSAIFLDYAHIPSTVKATVNAFRETYNEQKLVTCLELHTFSSLNKEYMPLYKDSLGEADHAIVYYNPCVLKQKRLPELSPEEIKKQFGREDLVVYNNSAQLEEYLKQLDTDTSVVLLLTSSNFSGIDLKNLAGEIIKQ